jgi:hypothetical protein
MATGLLLLLPLAAAGPAAGEEPRLHFVQVSAEVSGFTHVVNSDPERYGALKYEWMSPLVDIDGDGHLDVMVYSHHTGTPPAGAAEPEGGTAAVWLGRGDGTFVFDQRGYHTRWAFQARDPLWIDLTGNGAADGIVTEWSRRIGQVCLNDGKGYWRFTGLYLPGKSFGNLWGYMLIDTNGDGRCDGLWGEGVLLSMAPPPYAWGPVPPETIVVTEVWNAAEALGFSDLDPDGSPYRGREAFAVDLTGDDRNELVVQAQGPGGFYTSKLATRVLTRTTTEDGRETWIDTTAARGLPTTVGHCLYPEDIDADGRMDLVDLPTGHWYKNDGGGKFARSPQRIYDPETRSFQRRRGPPWTADCDLQWIDLTNNGFRDLVVGLDHGATEGATFLNLGEGRFVEVEGVPRSRRMRNFGDVTGDHRIDMVVYSDRRLHLLRNETPHRGMHVRLVPQRPAEASLGAKLWVYEAGRMGDHSRLVHYRQGFQAQRSGRSNVIDTDLHVGLGDREAVDIRVRFPSGVVREIRNAKADARVVVTEAEHRR